MLLTANSGGGKSYAIRKLLEETHGKALSIILDMEGEFHTLREHYDLLLIGGRSGDVKINLKAAKLLPVKILELRIPTILDLSDLKRHERVAFVKEFLQGLMEAPRELWQPSLVVVDEAHQFCGQQEKQDSTWAVIDLMTRGRKRGFCGVLCTQRISKLHKDAAAEANNKMIGRTGLDIDMKRASEELGFTSKQDMLSLRDLDAGEFFVFGPAISKHITKVRVGRVKTTHPKVGMRLDFELAKPSQKINAILSKLTDLPKEAEQELRDKQSMAKRIRELEYELRKKPVPSAPAIDRKQLDRAEKTGYNQAMRNASAQINSIAAANRKLQARLEQVAKIVGVKIEIPVVHQITPSVQPNPHFVQTSRPPVQKLPARVQNADESSDVQFGRCERMILKFLAMREGKSFTRSQIGGLTGYSPKSGGFNNAIYRLKAAGLIKQTGSGTFTILDVQGAADILGDNYNAPEQNSLEDWLGKLGMCPKKIYKELLENPDQVFTREELGEKTGYSPTSGGFNNAIYQLCSLGLAERTPEGIRLNHELLEV